ncbi:MAG TPA: DUF4124 domain-containing protein [Zeimonas sp.]|nr:DUF4124 domain-containing protein [Zeimonas sp.]
MPAASRRVVRPAVYAAVSFSLAVLGPSWAWAAPPSSGAGNAPIKWVDAKGRVHYSDRPPLPEQGAVRTQSVSARPAAPSIGDPTLPWALRSAAARYPVTLYTSPQCEPCDAARAHLARRGVPYVEKRVIDAEDAQAFHALGFERTLFPTASIGPERLIGYEAGGWDRALDATGYPKASMLPAGRKPGRIVPLRAPQDVAGRPTSPPDASAAERATEPAASASDIDSLLSPASFRTGPNPIRF